jgi:hypothetical protein
MRHQGLQPLSRAYHRGLFKLCKGDVLWLYSNVIHMAPKPLVNFGAYIKYEVSMLVNVRDPPSSAHTESKDRLAFLGQLIDPGW